MKRKKDIDIERLLTDDIEKLEYKIEHRKEYNNKNRFKYILIKSALILEMAFPFALGSLVTFDLFKTYDRVPFKKTKIQDKPSLQLEIDSLNNEKKYISFDEIYDDNKLEYSTSWYQNPSGYYERIEYEYEIELDNSDYENVLSLSKEEIDSMFKLINVRKIQKNILTEEDNKYNSVYVVLHQVIDDKNYYRVREEKDIENFLETAIFAFLVYCEGIMLEAFGGMFIKKSLRTNLKCIELKYKPVSKKDLIILKQILEQKKNNLKLLK